jgi:hypothetical protein
MSLMLVSVCVFVLFVYVYVCTYHTVRQEIFTVQKFSLLASFLGGYKLS